MTAPIRFARAMQRTSAPGSASALNDDTPVTARVRVFVPRSPEAVFDFFADLRNEPQYNGQVADITKASPGPVGAGTTFEGSHVGLGRVSWRLSEYERPCHVVIEGGVGQGAYRWTSDLTPAAGGTWFSGTMEWRPPRPWRWLRPVLELVLRINARRAFARMATVMARDSGESGPADA